MFCNIDDYYNGYSLIMMSGAQKGRGILIKFSTPIKSDLLIS